MNQRIESSEGDNRATLEAQKEKVKRAKLTEVQVEMDLLILLKMKFIVLKLVKKSLELKNFKQLINVLES